MREKIGKKGIAKRLFSVVLALAMVLSLLPMNSTTVYASDAQSGSIGSLSWSLDSEGNFSITGSGAMDDCANYGQAPWNSFRNDIKSLTVANTVTSIGDYTFSQCSNLTNITLSSNLTTIGKCAFRSCTNLESITIPASVTSIGAGAFVSTKIGDGGSVTMVGEPPTIPDFVFDFNPKIYVPKGKEEAYKTAWGRYANKIVMPHEHTWNYSPNGATLTATCTCNDQTEGYDDCEYNEIAAGADGRKVSLTLTASSANYTGNTYAGASLGDTTAWTSATLELPTIKYAGTGTTDYPESEDAPKLVGTYKASITVDNQTASVDFAIKPVSRSLNGLKTTYDDHWKYDSDGRIVCGCGRNWWLTDTEDNFLYLWDIDNAKLIGRGGEDKLKPGRYCCGDFSEDPSITPGVVPEGRCVITLEHEHDWRYSATDNKLEAYCANKYCPSEIDVDHKVSLTITASTPNPYGSAATITIGTKAEKEAWEAAGFTVPTTVTYEKTDGTALDAAPTTEGEYVAKVSPVDVTASAANTAKVSFKIENKPEEEEPEEIHYYEDVKPVDGEVKDITNSGDAAKESNPYATKIVNSSELEALVNVTAEEKAQGVNVWIKLVDASATMPEADKTKITSAAGTSTVGMFFDASLFKKVGDKDEVSIHDVNGKIKLSFVVPEALRKDGRNYEIIRVHEGEVATIAGTYDATAHTITFETDKFSSYALIYNDGTVAETVVPTAGVAAAVTPAAVTPAAPATVPASTSPKTGDTTNATWIYMIMLLGASMVTLAFYRRKENN